VILPSKRLRPNTKTEVKLNFGLSPDFSIQLKVSQGFAQRKAKPKVKVTQ